MKMRRPRTGFYIKTLNKNKVILSITVRVSNVRLEKIEIVQKMLCYA